jgi:hypothetical protein
MTRTALLIIAAASFLVAAPMSATADAPRKRTKSNAIAKPAEPPRRVYDGRDRWYPNNANQLRFGSQIWWDQMQKEGRIGRPSDG